MVYASTILFYLSVALSKCSVVFFLLRISPSQHRVIFLSAAAFIGAWMIAAVFAVALQCNLSHPWLSINQNCPGTVRQSVSDTVHSANPAAELAIASTKCLRHLDRDRPCYAVSTSCMVLADVLVRQIRCCRCIFISLAVSDGPEPGCSGCDR